METEKSTLNEDLRKFYDPKLVEKEKQEELKEALLKSVRSNVETLQ